ncbi:MAG: YopX family protein [Paraclostridium sp.]
MKVRAYDEVENKMIYTNDVYPNTKYKFEYERDNDGLSLMELKRKVRVYDENEEEYIHTEFKKVPFARMMDYIGINDKFGQEIYDLDNVELKISVYKQIGSKKKLIDIERYEGMIVKLWMCGWAIEYVNPITKKVDLYMLSNLINKDYTLLVTGNRFEN